MRLIKTMTKGGRKTQWNEKTKTWVPLSNKVPKLTTARVIELRFEFQKQNVAGAYSITAIK